MPFRHRRFRTLRCLALADSFLSAIRAVKTEDELRALMEAITREMDFRWFALIHHDDLRILRPDRVDLKDYPAAIADRIVGERYYRRDPVIRGSPFAGSAFLWSDLASFMQLDRHDHACFAFGLREGLNEGITVPYMRLGECTGSCTFAGIGRPEHAERLLGLAQMIGIFAFQAALRLLCRPPSLQVSPRLHPRPRDCVLLAGRGYSNKQIARALAITPRTVDGYLTEARRLFGAHDRAELIVSAILAGEIGLHELKGRQPE